MFLLLLHLGITLAGGMESGIVGGKEAKPHSRPYMASLQHKGSHKCGGMLIKENFVLTSAHCLNLTEYTGRNYLEVVLGAHNIKQEEPNQQRIQVRKYIRHPMYLRKDPTNITYDIMLLKLKTKAKLNKFVNMLTLPEANKKMPDNVKCNIAGWGLKKPNDKEASSVLREVTLKLEKNTVCKKKWQQYFNSDRMICSASDGKDAFCKGDSGSPLFCDNKPQALAAYTHPDNCTNTTFPEAYIKISYFIPWIKKMIK